MNIEKQSKVMDILTTGRYKVVGNDVLTFKRNEWRVLTGNTLPSGYRQHTLFNGKRGVNGIKVIVYQHILCYIAHNGAYPANYVIDHIDKDKTNNRIDNLRAIEQKHNINPSQMVATKLANKQGIKTIRSAEIANIKQYMSLGYSQSKIAKILGLNRLSVRHVYNKALAGEPLKYE